MLVECSLEKIKNDTSIIILPIKQFHQLIYNCDITCGVSNFLNQTKKEQKIMPVTEINDFGTKLHSGPLQLWSFNNLKDQPIQHNSVRANNVYRA